MNHSWKIKTKEEFIESDLWSPILGVPKYWNSGGSMNYLMGTFVPRELWPQCEAGEIITIDRYKIPPEHYIKGPQEFSVTGTPEAPQFDLARLAKEIDNMFQDKLDASKNQLTLLSKNYGNSLKELWSYYDHKVQENFSNIKDRLIAEISRGHTTIVLPNNCAIAIQEMDHPAMAEVVQSLGLYHKAMLVGPAGTGKTYMIAEIAERMELPFYKYSCSRDSSVHDLIGYKQPQSEIYLETVFIKAYEHGGIFLVDEYDAMSGDMALFFNGIADGSKFISIPHRDIAPIAKKHENFYLVMCGNTWGKGSIEYSGRDFQDMALMDRFRFCRHFVGYHHAFESFIMGANYSFALNLRKEMETYSSYLSTRNVEDLSILINAKKPKKVILEMITQDLPASEKQKVLNALENAQIRYPT